MAKIDAYKSIWAAEAETERRAKRLGMLTISDRFGHITRLIRTRRVNRQALDLVHAAAVAQKRRWMEEFSPDVAYSRGLDFRTGMPLKEES